ncbi:hypothetical protein F5887DRAFT_1079213 [Amanita rubescens]|nr:hypothetical protein F5887DRAFT_1079213 [Amanita rubescens]
MPLKTQCSNSKKYLNLSGNGTVLRPLQKSMWMKALNEQRAKNEQHYQQQQRARLASQFNLAAEKGVVTPDSDDDLEGNQWFDVEDDEQLEDQQLAMDVLDGSEPVPISHAGGEFNELFCDEIRKLSKSQKKDYRTRRDRVQRRHEGFTMQLSAMVRAYQKWSYNIRDHGGIDASVGGSYQSDGMICEGTSEIVVLDTYRTFKFQYSMFHDDEGIAAALVRQGLIPCAPFNPQYAISIRVLELFRNLHNRCPHLAIQPFVKGLLDMHGIHYQMHYQKLFSIGFDVYLEIIEANRQAVLKFLKRDQPDYRLKNTCPACSYRLKDEVDQTFEILITFDGNNSLKHLRREGASDDDSAFGQSLPDSRRTPGDYYISREEVNRWAKSGAEEELIPGESSDSGTDSASPCSSRWSNMNDGKTA